MTEQRYYLNKHLLRKDEFHDVICHRFMDLEETLDELNQLYGKCSHLKNENEKLKKDVEFFKGYREDVEELTVENVELKEIIVFANNLMGRTYFTYDDYWAFRKLCEDKGVNLK